jgi:hypothetical protein
MNYLFVLIDDNIELDNMVIFIDDDTAKIASIKNPDKRVEIFTKTKNGYKPSRCFYKNGMLIEA